MSDRKFTTWSPDTCSCVIEYYNDDGSLRRIIDACKKHVDSSDPLSAVVRHNRRKNVVLNELIKVHGINIESDDVFVGYDRKNDKNNDPVIIAGLGNFLKKRGRSETKEEVLNEIKGSLSINEIILKDIE